jgi:hypothetical protein
MTPPWSPPHARPPGHSSGDFRPACCSSLFSRSSVILVLLLFVRTIFAMPSTRRLELREEARLMFRHGWENYWDIAFPEDEVGGFFFF